MPIYTVHEPPVTRREERRGPERFVFVRDGFHFWAFLLTPFWMLRRGLWLVLFGYLLVSLGLLVGMRWLGASLSVIFWMEVLLSILVGLEAASLRRWTLRRRKWREAGLVSADNAEAAERRFFDAWADGNIDVAAATVLPRVPPAARPWQQPAVRGRGQDIVGLFPEPEARR